MKVIKERRFENSDTMRNYYDTVNNQHILKPQGELNGQNSGVVG
jgi:hypothetical protein